MDLNKIIKTNNFNNTFIFGWYGGGNFGDELLLAMLLNLLNNHDYKDLSYLYIDAEIKELLNQKYDYAEAIKPRLGLMKKLFNTRNIVVGGGGHWGQDMNKNVFIMTLILFFSRFLLGKKVFLLGVGFYNSTNTLGRISAWLAAKASITILARDKESFENFRRYNPGNTYLDKDIAFSLPDLSLNKQKYNDSVILEELDIKSLTRTVLITVRHMQNGRGENYVNAIDSIIQKNPNVHFTLMALEPREKYPENYQLVKDLGSKYQNVSYTDSRFNPLEFVMFLNQNASKIIMIAPQYHAQLIAHLAGITHFPVVYDNKVRELLDGFDMKEQVKIDDVTIDSLQSFIDANY